MSTKTYPVKAHRTLALVIALSPLARAQLPLHHLKASGTFGQAGVDFVSMEDIDGDGVRDIVVGYPGSGSPGSGAGFVQAFSGASGSPLWTADGAVPTSRFGAALERLPDLDSDGYDDLAVGAPGHDEFGLGDNGMVMIISGRTGDYIKWMFGDQSGEQLGHSIVSVTGAIIAVGSPLWDASSLSPDRGRIQMWDIAGAPILVGTYPGTQDGMRLGHALSLARDLNGDYIADVFASAPGYDKPGFPFGLIDSGRIFAISGATLSTIFTLDGPSSNAELGHSLASGYDLNGDGDYDFVAGSPLFSTGGAGAGAVLAYDFGPGVNLLWRIDGGPSDELGFAVAMLPDIDGDGKADVVIGAPGVDVGQVIQLANVGEAYLCNGSTGSVISTTRGAGAGDRMGAHVGQVGQLNADPYPEPVVCAPENSPATVQVLMGNAPVPTSYCTPKTNSQGCVPAIGWSGVPSSSVGDDDFHLTATNVIENKAGILIWSWASKSSPFYGGTLCLQAPVKRTAVQNSTTVQSSLPCEGVYDFHFSAAYRSSQGVSAGDTLYFQYWSRDAGFAPPNSIGLTDALQATMVP